jgi:hypothetical protein
MVCFVNVDSVDRSIYSLFQRFNLEWRNRTLRALHTQLAIILSTSPLPSKAKVCYHPPNIAGWGVTAKKAESRVSSINTANVARAWAVMLILHKPRRLHHRPYE